MRGVRPVIVALCASVLSGGCGSDSSGPSSSAPFITNLIVSHGSNRTVLFQMAAADGDADLVGGECDLTAFGFTAQATMTVAAAVPPNPSFPLAVTCTVSVPAGLTGQPVTGSIAVTDAAGHRSNDLRFSVTLPEGRREAG